MQARLQVHVHSEGCDVNDNCCWVLGAMHRMTVHRLQESGANKFVGVTPSSIKKRS